MGLTPEEIERRDFASTLRGYDRDEVRSFLKKVGDTVRELQDEVANADQRGPEAAPDALAASVAGPTSKPTGSVRSVNG